jgi:hypothetical protein
MPANGKWDLTQLLKGYTAALKSKTKDIIIIIIIIISGSAAQRGLWSPRPQSFLITHNDVPQSIRLLWTSEQVFAGTST